MRTKREIIGRALRHYLANAAAFTGITGILVEFVLFIAAFVRFLAGDPGLEIKMGFFYFQKAVFLLLLLLFLGMLLIYLVLSIEDRKLFQKMIYEENDTPEDCCRWILRETEDLSICKIYFSEDVVERAKHTEMGMMPKEGKR